MGLVGDMRRRRMSGDRGAAMIEGAILAPVFFLLLFAVLEFGLAFRTYLTVANGTRLGARSASTAGNDLGGDFAILQEIKDALGAIPQSEINYIVIFNAGGVDGDLGDPGLTTCRTTSVSGVCNRYTAADLNRPQNDFGCDSDSPDKYWCPSTRDVRLSGPPDYVGIFIQADYDYVTGLFGSGRIFEDETVYRIEPREK